MYLAWRETISGVVHNDRTCLREIIVVQNDRQVFEVNYPTVPVCRFASGIKEHKANINLKIHTLKTVETEKRCFYDYHVHRC